MVTGRRWQQGDDCNRETTATATQELDNFILSRWDPTVMWPSVDWHTYISHPKPSDWISCSAVVHLWCHTKQNWRLLLFPTICQANYGWINMKPPTATGRARPTHHIDFSHVMQQLARLIQSCWDPIATNWRALYNRVVSHRITRASKEF
jgi:hypothetical protein